jgi:hypothetical protein
LREYGVDPVVMRCRRGTQRAARLGRESHRRTIRRMSPQASAGLSGTQRALRAVRGNPT